MSKSGIASIIAQGSKVWLDSVDPALIDGAIASGATGATSNPIIISDLIKSGRFDKSIDANRAGRSAEELAWILTDELVTQAERSFLPIFDRSQGEDGYVSFELDPLLEDYSDGHTVADAAERYVRLATRWAEGHPNRLIKVPATEAGIMALEDMVAAGVNVNVTLIFTPRQYHACRDAVWKGAGRRGDLTNLKSVYSIFVSRVDVYTQQHVPSLNRDAQGQVALLNAKEIWRENRAFWSSHNLRLAQEMVFASTGTKDPAVAPDFYVAALVGSDIQTNPPATNDAVETAGKEYSSTIELMPSDEVIAEIKSKVDMAALERVLMAEGIKKFCDPQRQLLDLIASRI